MVLYGDICDSHLFSLGPRAFQSATAIITANTSQGFFLAADGRRRKEENGALSIQSDQQQKVFAIMDERARFAFAVSGTAAFTADHERGIIFDFKEAIQKAAAALKSIISPDAASYCERLARAVNKSIRDSITEARAQGKTVTLPTNPDPLGQNHSLIAMLFMCGYYGKTSRHVLFEFFHRSGELAKPLTAKILTLGDFMVSGSDVIAARLYSSDDPDFAEFRRHQVTSPVTLTFEELGTVAKDYVAACESESGLTTDQQICESIGGHVHAAKVTTTGGFEWIIPPLIP